MSELLITDSISTVDKCLTEEEKNQLVEQNKRIISSFKAEKLEKEAQRNWDLFYKRNETRFFKDRHWTTREFEELLTQAQSQRQSLEAVRKHEIRKVFEVGCGVGNLIFPLIASEQMNAEGNEFNYFFYACDFSPRAVDFVRANPLYDERFLNVFHCDITTDGVHEHIPADTLDIVTLIFVLSAIHPDKFAKVVQNLWKLLKPDGVVLFRDYGLYDMAQLRFKPGHKIAENLYMRQDGTRSYYFSQQELSQLFEANGFQTISNHYVHRRTLNIKEGINVPRIFLQSKFKKLKLEPH